MGSVKSVFGVETYVTGETNSDARNIVIFSDIFGLKLKNSFLIADLFAAAGYRVYIPDMFEGDALELSVRTDPTFDLQAWRLRHPSEQVGEITSGFIGKLRNTLGPSKLIATVGYCYGGPFTFHSLAKDGAADIGAVAHPSKVTIEDVQNTVKPIAIHGSDLDGAYPAELRLQTEAILSENNVRFQTTLFSGVNHGFATRGDMNDPVQRYAKEKSFTNILEWFATVKNSD